MPFTADTIVRELLASGITHVIWLPDTTLDFLYDKLRESGLVLIPVCREAEAVAIAAGLIWGGKRPLVLLQNTGVFDAGDAIRGFALQRGLPLVMMVGYRGGRRHGPVRDSAAALLEPTLTAWGVAFHVLDGDRDARKIRAGCEASRQQNKPVALLVRRSPGLVMTYVRELYRAMKRADA